MSLLRIEWCLLECVLNIVYPLDSIRTCTQNKTRMPCLIQMELNCQTWIQYLDEQNICFKNIQQSCNINDFNMRIIVLRKQSWYELKLGVKNIRNQANDMWWFDNFQSLPNTTFLWSLNKTRRWHRLWQCAEIIVSRSWILRKLRFLEVRRQLL